MILLEISSNDELVDLFNDDISSFVHERSSAPHLSRRVQIPWPFGALARPIRSLVPKLILDITIDKDVHVLALSSTINSIIDLEMDRIHCSNFLWGFLARTAHGRHISLRVYTGSLCDRYRGPFSKQVALPIYKNI